MKKLTLALLCAGIAVFSTPSYAQDKHVAVVIKATNSEFWQFVLVGARNYAKEHPGVIVTTDGPPNEADIDQQVSILENVISRHPDGIVLASTSSDATVPAIEKAAGEGIPVVTIDNRVKTDKVASFLATNNTLGGKLAAQELVNQLKAAGHPLKGKVAVISAMAAVQVLVDRDAGFVAGMKEYAPDITVIPARFTNNDVFVAVNTAHDLMLSNPDIVGVFADNNTTGDGTARVLTESGKQDSVIGVAFDSDPQEVEGLKSGALKGLVLQDPYGMGYRGVESVLHAIAGEKLPAYVDTGANVVTKANMNDQRMQELLNPAARAK
jgi:ribose transport system substrate-binding protein